MAGRAGGLADAADRRDERRTKKFALKNDRSNAVRPGPVLGECLPACLGARVGGGLAPTENFTKCCASFFDSFQTD